MLGSPCRSVDPVQADDQPPSLHSPAARCTRAGRVWWGRDAVGERASASTDASALLRATFGNLDKMKSAEVDLKLAIQPRGTSAAAGPGLGAPARPVRQPGPRQAAEVRLHRRAAVRRAELQRGRDLDGTKGYVSLMGTHYEVSDLVMKQFVAAYEQSLKSARPTAAAGWCSAASASTSRSGSDAAQRGHRQGRRRGHDQDQRQGRHQAGHRRPGQDHPEGGVAERPGRERRSRRSSLRSRSRLRRTRSRR